MRFGNAIWCAELECSDERLGARAAGLLGLLETDHPDLPQPSVRFELARLGEMVQLRANGRAGEPWPTEEEALADFHWSVGDHASRVEPGMATIHAGLVAFGDRPVLIPGDPGSGKSSLTVACCLLGAAFGGDDLALLDLRSSSLVPFPLAPALDAEGLEYLEDSARESVMLECELWRDVKQIRCYLDARACAAERMEMAPAASVVFRQPEHDGPSRLEPLSPAEALRRLYEHAGFVWDDRSAVFDSVGRLVERASSFAAIGDASELALLIREQVLL